MKHKISDPCLRQDKIILIPYIVTPMVEMLSIFSITEIVTVVLRILIA
jgi:hypothetical protein